MRSSFAKSIYVSAAVLGLAGLSAVTTTTTASAKSLAVGTTTLAKPAVPTKPVVPTKPAVPTKRSGGVLRLTVIDSP